MAMAMAMGMVAAVATIPLGASLLFSGRAGKIVLCTGGVIGRNEDRKLDFCSADKCGGG